MHDDDTAAIARFMIIVILVFGSIVTAMAFYAGYLVTH